MTNVLTKEQKTQFNNDGFLILNDFINTNTCNSLIGRADELIQAFDPDEMKVIFSTTNIAHAKNHYFLNSGDKIRFFFEAHAISDTGELQVEKSNAINKIGHALHDLDPVFYRFSRMKKIAQVVNDLEIQTPRLLQSMYICKQAFIGGEVMPHQDSTYLYIEGGSVTGLWFALQNATIENGCLWAIPGGHKQGLKSRFFRNRHDEIWTEYYDRAPYPLDSMIPLEVPQGSMIILHGLLPHMSKENNSSQSRNAYTLHVFSGQHKYPEDNWLQRPKEMPFCGFEN